MADEANISALCFSCHKDSGIKGEFIQHNDYTITITGTIIPASHTYVKGVGGGRSGVFCKNCPLRAGGGLGPEDFTTGVINQQLVDKLNG